MKAFILVLTLLWSFSATANLRDSAVHRMAYPPSFWQNKLRLSSAQLSRLAAIEADFYRSLIDLKSGKGATLDVILVVRNKSMWATLSKRQQVKWLKIISYYERRTTVKPAQSGAS